MKAELCVKLNAVQAQRLYYAYCEICAVYEDVCNGPGQARAYIEYLAACASRSTCRWRYEQLINNYNDGEQ